MDLRDSDCGDSRGCDPHFYLFGLATSAKDSLIPIIVFNYF
jgi:hypothetical protein